MKSYEYFAQLDHSRVLSLAFTRGEYMTKEEQDEQDMLFARAIRAEADLYNQQAEIEARLQEIGRSMISLSRDLSLVPPVFNIDRASVEADIVELWDLQARYKNCSDALDKCRREISQYRTSR